MSVQILKGAAVAAALNERTLEIIEEKLSPRGVKPALAIVRTGEREDDLSYERAALKRCAALGIDARAVRLPETVSQREVMEVLGVLDRDSSVHGILVFRPLPGHLDEKELCVAVRPEKDVDGMNPASLAGICGGAGFAPCTPSGVMELLDHYYGRDFCRGKRAVVLGRSGVVGLPAALLLMARDATVTICHSRTPDPAALCREADIVVSACGRTDSIGREYFAPGQVLIDVGIGWSREKNRLCGDLRQEEAVEAAITPVPGGVGAVTTAVLALHTVQAAVIQLEGK